MLGLCLAACGTLRDERAVHASSCQVEFYENPLEVLRPHRLVAKVTASCKRAKECRETLRARACTLHADAVLMGRSAHSAPSHLRNSESDVAAEVAAHILAAQADEPGPNDLPTQLQGVTAHLVAWTDE